MPHRPDENGGDEEPLRSRSEERRAEKTREDALARLAKELVQLADRKLEQLDLADEALDAIREARAIRSHIAKNRQLRVVRSALRDADWAAIRVKLDGLLEHGTVPVAADGAERQWVVRLVGGGSRELEAFLSGHPHADRRHLRQLIRNAQATAPVRRKRAEDKLAQVVRSLMTH